MPITQSAKKALRQNIRRRKRNLERTSAMKDAIKKALKSKEGDRKAAIATAYKAIDKAAKTGAIKRNAAARRKSRLMKTLQRATRR